MIMCSFLKLNFLTPLLWLSFSLTEIIGVIFMILFFKLFFSFLYSKFGVVINKKKRSDVTINPKELSIKNKILFSNLFLKIKIAGIDNKLIKNVNGKVINPKPIGPPLV